MTELEKANQRIAALEAQEVELCTLYGIVQAENGKLRADLEAIGAGGVSGPLMRTPTSGAADLPEALRIAAALEYCDANVAREAINELRRLHALTAQAPSQLGGFSSGDMASAAAQGYRDGWTAAQAISAEPAGAGYAALPESLMLAVDRWFADNTGLGGCSDKDVRGLAELFYDVTYEGGRESVDDALAIVESFGPGIGGLNDTYARQVLLAAEVTRLRGIYKSAVAGRASMRDALRASHGQAPAQPHHVEAMERAWLWMENQADGQSKGGHATFDLMMLRKERDALRTAIDATPLPQAAQQAPAGESLRTDALCDLSYSHGLKAGWNYCASDDLAGFERAQKIGTEALRTLKSPTAQAADSVLYDPKAVLETFNSARAGSDKPVGYLRGILAVIAHWESRPEPQRWMLPAPADSVLEDAARYQWLRQHWFTMSSNYKGCITFRIGEPRWSDITEEALDAAIDAAMTDAARAAQKEGEKP